MTNTAIIVTTPDELPALNKHSGRALTSGEIHLARTVFAAEIDYAKVRVVHRSFLPFGTQPNNRAMAPNGKIYFDPKGDLYEADFSIAGIHAKALFIHEMTHVWQHQKGINVKFRGIFQRRYKYLPLIPGKKFSSYGIEQQGDMVRDYFYLMNNLGRPGWPPLSAYRMLIPFVR